MALVTNAAVNTGVQIVSHRGPVRLDGRAGVRTPLRGRTSPLRGRTNPSGQRRVLVGRRRGEGLGS